MLRWLLEERLREKQMKLLGLPLLLEKRLVEPEQIGMPLEQEKRLRQQRQKRYERPWPLEQQRQQPREKQRVQDLLASNKQQMRQQQGQLLRLPRLRQQA
jgi:hypothetical protein